MCRAALEAVSFCRCEYRSAVTRSSECPSSMETERPVKSAPTLLRRRMSRFSRMTEKFVACAPTAGSSAVLDVQWLLS